MYGTLLFSLHETRPTFSLRGSGTCLLFPPFQTRSLALRSGSSCVVHLDLVQVALSLFPSSSQRTHSPFSRQGLVLTFRNMKKRL